MLIHIVRVSEVLWQSIFFTMAEPLKKKGALGKGY